MCTSTNHSVTHTYNDTVPSVVTTTIIKSGLTSTSTTLMDNMGHVTRTQLNTDPDCATGADNTDTAYDGFGRVLTVSNPYCSTNVNPYTSGVTTYSYDAVGRTLSVKAPDTGTTTTSYATPCYTVTDPKNDARTTCSDGIGRLTAVTEDPGSSGHLNYLTNYAYTVDSSNNSDFYRDARHANANLCLRFARPPDQADEPRIGDHHLHLLDALLDLFRRRDGSLHPHSTRTMSPRPTPTPIT